MDEALRSAQEIYRKAEKANEYLQSILQELMDKAGKDEISLEDVVHQLEIAKIEAEKMSGRKVLIEIVGMNDRNMQFKTSFYNPDEEVK